jgi:hypothetical protein
MMHEQGHKIFAGCLTQTLQKAGLTACPSGELP